jgi:fructan beta-fructosidase
MNGSFLKFLLLYFILAGFCPASSRAADIVMADFEETNYAWLPGGLWTRAGSAFGPAPAQGTLPSQNPVSGYLGNGLVNTFYNGDATTGVLTSPPFTIQRKYIKFLIGAGNHRGQTCLNLLINGRVALSAVGMGNLEQLDWLQWNVSAYANQTAQLQIVDSYTAGWGHVNVDQIVQTDESLPNLIVASQRYLNLPVSYTGTNHLVELIQNGLVVHEFNIALLTNGTPDYYAFLDLSAYQGEMLVRVDSQLANSNQLAALIQSSNIITSVPIYQEALRPLYHYTARRGWLNDPNGMVYYNGQYHLYYQHNPYGPQWDNMHWGNAVSSDLVHWQELPEAIYPDWLGAIWSGSAVMDGSDSAGFGTNALVAFYTAAGGHGNNPRMSIGQLFTQCMAYSLDQGQTWTKYTNNPIIQNLVGGDNRDPKVIWFEPGHKWVMVFWLINNDFGFFSSTDLKNWTQNSTFTFPGVIEVPELFQLPLDGETNNLRWVFWAGAGHYYVGQFDGNQFSPQYGPSVFRQGNSMAAAQTFNNVPATDGRRILISQGTVSFPNMPFNSIMNFPVALTLQSASAGAWLCANPVGEIALLRRSTNAWPAQVMPEGVNILAGATGEACEISAQFQPGNAGQITFNLRGTTVNFDCHSQQVSCEGVTNELHPNAGVVDLHFLVDRGSLEIFCNGGSLYMPMRVMPVAGPQPLSLVATASEARLISLDLYNLGSSWPAAPPVILTQPSQTAAELGGPTALSVVAAGATVPFSYQWFCGGQPIPGATHRVLSVFPVPATNRGYNVVVSNAAGAVTSSVVQLTLPPP